MAADADGDGKLSKTEYLAFLHPEHEPKMRDVVIKVSPVTNDKNNLYLLRNHTLTQKYPIFTCE